MWDHGEKALMDTCEDKWPKGSAIGLDSMAFISLSYSACQVSKINTTGQGRG